MRMSRTRITVQELFWSLLDAGDGEMIRIENGNLIDVGVHFCNPRFNVLTRIAEQASVHCWNRSLKGTMAY